MDEDRLETHCEICDALFAPGELNCRNCGMSKQNRDDRKKIAILEDRVKYLDTQLCLAREERKTLIEAARRGLLYVTIFRQNTPGWNGNAFDDDQYIRKVIGESYGPCHWTDGGMQGAQGIPGEKA
jgi:hypothetical protein